jgi:hypothetical protein
MSRERRGIGSVMGKSEDRNSMRDRIVEEEAAAREAEENENEQDGMPDLDLSYGDAFPETEEEEDTKPKKTKKRKRNHRLPIDYFKAMDDILADSYTKQEAAFNILESFTRMMESRGIASTFESEKFEKAAGNLAQVAMIREMAWLFGLGPDLSERIAEHTADRLFSPGHVTTPKISKV